MLKLIDMTAVIPDDDCINEDGGMAKIIEVEVEGNPFVRIINWSDEHKHPEWMRVGAKLRVTIEEVT